MRVLTRRTFLKSSVLSLASLSCAGRFGRLLPGEREKGKVDLWNGNIFTQSNVSLTKYEEGTIKAKVDGRWREYTVRELPQEFVDWNIGSRLETLEQLRRGGMPSLAGPHSASVASYGGGRFDTQFTINNAVKGLGFVPHANRIEEVMERLVSTEEASMNEKLQILEEIYREDGLLDRRKQISLELYTERDFETHTFLNIMVNPSVSVVFLDIPSYEIRAIARLVHPDDEKASADEKKMVRYVNLVHDYFHGRSPRKSIAIIFHVIEVFDNSPASRGIRVIPT